MRNSKKCRQQADSRTRDKVKVVAKNYHVTSQTAYHIAQLAMENNTSEGRIIDKLIRTYKASMEYGEGSAVG